MSTFDSFYVVRQSFPGSGEKSKSSLYTVRYPAGAIGGASDLAFYTVLCTLGFIIIMVLLGGGGVLVRRRCVKAAEKERQKDLLLRKLVAKTGDIERGLNDDGDGARE